MHADSTLNTIAPRGLTAPANTPRGCLPRKRGEGIQPGGAQARQAVPGDRTGTDINRGGAMSCRGRIRDTAYTEQEDHGGGTRITLAIHTEDGMGPGPQGAGRLLDMRTAHRLQPRAVER